MATSTRSGSLTPSKKRGAVEKSPVSNKRSRTDASPRREAGTTASKGPTVPEKSAKNLGEGTSTLPSPGASTPKKVAGKSKAVGKKPAVTKKSPTKPAKSTKDAKVPSPTNKPEGDTGKSAQAPTGPAKEQTAKEPTGGAATSGDSGAGSDTPSAPEPPASDETRRDDPPAPPPLPGTEGPAFTRDEEIIRGWSKLEKIIARFVDTAFIDRLPAEAIVPGRFPYAALHKLSGEPKLMCQSPRYAKYVFQSAIWNILDSWFFSRAGIAWACEGVDAASDSDSHTKGLVAAIGKLTWDLGVRQDSNKSFDARLDFFRWRRDTVDFLFNNVIDEALFGRKIQEVVVSILQTFKGHFSPELDAWDGLEWDELVHRTEFVVAEAATLAIKMRRSETGVWLPFHPTPGSGALPEAVSVHKDTEVALPPGQTEVLANSTVTMTVVPGLAKHTAEIVIRPGVPWSKVVNKTKRRAKCFIDLLPAHITGEQ